MEIKVLGSGCARCGAQYEEARKAIELAGVQADLSKVSDIGEIASWGVLGTPAVVVDGKVMSAGRVARAEQIAGWLKEASR